MANKIKMVYPLMDEMSKNFQQGAQTLEHTISEMQAIANTLQEGALLGRGGQAFTESIRNDLCPALSRMVEKFNELNQDIKFATDKMKAADRESARGMG
jgi:WXG100 family type VII secretion target